MLIPSNNQSLNQFKDQFAGHYLFEMQKFSGIEYHDPRDWEEVMEIFKRCFTSHDINRANHFNESIKSLHLNTLAQQALSLARVYFELLELVDSVWNRSESITYGELESISGKFQRESLLSLKESCSILTFYKFSFEGDISKEKLFELTEKIRTAWEISKREFYMVNEFSDVKNNRFKSYTIKDLLISNLVEQHIATKPPAPKSRLKIPNKVREKSFGQSGLMRPMQWPSTAGVPIKSSEQPEKFSGLRSSEIDPKFPQFLEFRDPAKEKKKPAPKFEIPQIPRIQVPPPKTEPTSKPIDTFELTYEENDNDISDLIRQLTPWKLN